MIYLKQCGCGDIVGKCGCLKRELEGSELRIKDLEKKLALAEGEWKTYAKMSDELSKKLAEATFIPDDCSVVKTDAWVSKNNKLALAVEALEFYQEITSDMWISFADDWSDGVRALIDDEGKRAREALKQIAE